MMMLGTYTNGMMSPVIARPPGSCDFQLHPLTPRQYFVFLFVGGARVKSCFGVSRSDCLCVSHKLLLVHGLIAVLWYHRDIVQRLLAVL